MRKVKFKIVSGDTMLQDYCSKTGSSWTFASEDSKLLNYGEAARIKSKVAFGPFGGPLEIVEVELPDGDRVDTMNEWVDYKGSDRTADSNGLRLALMARGRALNKYEDKWDLLSEEIQNALVLSEVALIIGDQDHDPNFEWAVAVVERSLIDLGY